MQRKNADKTRKKSTITKPTPRLSFTLASSKQSVNVNKSRYIMVVDLQMNNVSKLLPLPCLAIYRLDACAAFKWRNVT